MDKEYRILLYDDNSERVKLLADELKKTGLNHSIRHAGTKQAYINELNEFEPDIIFAESNVSELPGLEAMSIAQEVAPQTSFILLTASIDEPTVLRKIKSDPDGFIASQRMSRVKAAVQAALDIKNATDQKTKADKALKEREKLFRVAVNNIPDTFIIYDAERRIRFVNQKGIEVAGMRVEEIIGRKDEELFPPHVTEKYLPSLKKAVDTKTPQKVDCTIILPTGTYSFIADYIPLVNEDGELYQVLGITHDLTWHRVAEQALRESEERFRRLSEATNEGIAIHDKGLILDANERLAAMFGYELHEIVGMNIIELAAPGSRNSVEKNIKSGYDRAFEASAVRKDGTEFSVEIIGRPARFQGKEAKVSVIRDITESKHVKEELIKSVSLLSATLESTADGILVVDGSGKIISFNKHFQDMWRIPQSVIETRDDNAVIDFVLLQLKDPDGFLKKIREVYAGPKSESFDILEFKDGRVFERYSKPQLIAGASVGRVWSFRDVTERQRAEEKIRGSLAEKEVLIKEIHHRVKNNLQIISSLLKLQSSSIKDSEAQEYFKISRNRVQSMALIHEKLYRAKELSKIDFAAYLTQLTSHLLNSYGNPEHIKLNLNAGKIVLDIDTAVPCGLLVNELVSNSLKHAFPDGKKGEINIEIFLDPENQINLKVSDNGIGLTGKPEEAGKTSLGLQLVNSLTRQLGGIVCIENLNGTCTSVKFPPVIYAERK